MIVVLGKLRPNQSYPGSHIIQIRCPHCSKNHQHGWPEGSGMKPQRRVPHCASDYGGPSNEDYFIAPGPQEDKKLTPPSSRHSD